MSIHKLKPDRGSPDSGPLAVGLTFQHELYDLADTVLKTRAIRALEHAAACYRLYRSIRCAARRKVEEIFDDLALKLGLTALRLDENVLLLDGPGVFVHAEGTRKADYCSCELKTWADNSQRLEELRTAMLEVVGECYAREQMFTIDWHFMNSRSGLHSASFDELMEKSILDEAYPVLDCNVDAFVQRYLQASETVLILQGGPGTGKTRLVRAILSALSRRKNDSAKVMYTADKKAVENDEIFVEFITGTHDAFVIEDADHMLLARSSGNQDLHRFLTIADGVVRAQGRKIIFTTNLPNVNDLDEALLRPGRCFANVRTRGLTREEALRLLLRLTGNDDAARTVLDNLFSGGARNATVAQIYRAATTLNV